jgi:hypothetical protein
MNYIFVFLLAVALNLTNSTVSAGDTTLMASFCVDGDCTETMYMIADGQDAMFSVMDGMGHMLQAVYTVTMPNLSNAELKCKDNETACHKQGHECCKKSEVCTLKGCATKYSAAKSCVTIQAGTHGCNWLCDQAKSRLGVQDYDDFTISPPDCAYSSAAKQCVGTTVSSTSYDCCTNQ